MLPRMVIVGGGNIASAILSGLVEGAGLDPCRLHVVEPQPEQACLIASRYGVTVVGDIATLPAGLEIVIWAVKPQVLRAVIDASKGRFSGALHVSVAAGITSQRLSAWLGTAQVVRAMPNTAMAMGKGVTGLYAASAVSEPKRAWVQGIFEAVGQVVWVQSDADIDLITAVSGSGPAYVFEVLDAFQNAAIALGFEADQAKDMVLQVMEGAVLQARRSGLPFHKLRANVTSKKGTTEAALDVLASFKLADAFKAAVAAAHRRAGELSSEAPT